MATAVRSRRKAKKGGLTDTTRFLVAVFLAALVFRTFLLAPFMIPSGSMLPRMMIGDYLFVAKWPYGVSRYALPFGLGHFHGRWFAHEPRRGDIVVFRYPGSDQDYVKRLIGLPGDRVQVRGGQLFLNAKPVPRVRIADWLMPRSPNSPCRYVHPEGQLPLVVDRGREYCRYMRWRETLPGGRSYEVLDQVPDGEGDDTPVYTVPAGHYFMMGDNRDDSEDSRFPRSVGGVGFLPADNLIGRAEIIFFSTDGSASWLKPWTWFTATRWSRIGRPY
jgi:signal peptidase I